MNPFRAGKRKMTNATYTKQAHVATYVRSATHKAFRPAQLTDLAFLLLQPLPLVGRQARSLPSVTLGLAQAPGLPAHRHLHACASGRQSR